MADRETGTVKWFSNTKGYGFIERPDGGDLFVHFSSVRGTGFKRLTEGQRVGYVVTQGEKGPQAQDVGPATDEIARRVQEEIRAASAATAVTEPPGAPTAEEEAEVTEDLVGSKAEEQAEEIEEPDASEAEGKGPELAEEPDASESEAEDEATEVVVAVDASEADQQQAEPEADEAPHIPEAGEDGTISAGAEAQSRDKAPPEEGHEA